MKHDELAADLAAHLLGSTDRLVWLDMQLGPSGTQRPDVYAIEKTYARLDARVFEIKVSRSDFLSDVTSGKWQGYLRWCNAVTFAVPEGLVRRDEVPAGCGLMVRGEAGWRSLRKPVLQRLDELPTTVWQKLLFDGIARHVTPKHNERVRAYAAERRARQVLGEEWGRAINNRDWAIQALRAETARLEAEKAKTADEVRTVVDSQIKEARAELDRVNKAISEVAVTVGLEPGAPTYCVVGALRGLVSPDFREKTKQFFKWSESHRKDLLRAEAELRHIIGEVE